MKKLLAIPAMLILIYLAGLWLATLAYSQNITAPIVVCGNDNLVPCTTSITPPVWGSGLSYGTSITVPIATPPPPPAEKDMNFLLAMDKQELCNECGFRSAVACIPYNPNCGIPSMTMRVYTPYATTGAALAYLDAPHEGTFVGLYRLEKLKMRVDLVDHRIHHPDTVEQVTTYALEELK